MLGAVSLGKTAKALDEIFLKFLKRLGSLSDVWMVYNDIWTPFERTPNTRPGIHMARCTGIKLEPECHHIVYKTEPIKGLVEAILSVKGKKTEIIYEQTEDVITLSFNNERFIIATAIPSMEYDNRLPAAFVNAGCFDVLKGVLDWNKLSSDTLMQIKHGVLIEFADEEIGMARLTRGLFKLRGRSERINAPVTYEAFYHIDSKEDIIANLKSGTIFSKMALLVHYGFIEVMHDYVIVPYYCTEKMMDTSSVELDLFYDDGTDEYDDIDEEGDYDYD